LILIRWICFSSAVMASALRQTGRRAWERSGVLQCVKTARTHSPFTRASSAGLAGKRTAACLRLEEPSSAGPCQAEQRSEPAGPRSRVPGGSPRGGWASSPPWLAVKGEKQTRQKHLAENDHPCAATAELHKARASRNDKPQPTTGFGKPPHKTDNVGFSLGTCRILH